MITKNERDLISGILWRIERSDKAHRDEMEKFLDQLRKLAGLPAPNPAPAE